MLWDTLLPDAYAFFKNCRKECTEKGTEFREKSRALLPAFPWKRVCKFVAVGSEWKETVRRDLQQA